MRRSGIGGEANTSGAYLKRRSWPAALDVAAQAIVSFQGNCGSAGSTLEIALLTRSGPCRDFQFALQQTVGRLLDHLVGGGEECLRNGEAESLRGLKIDGQIEFGWLLHWQIGGLDSIEHLSCVGARQAISVGDARPIAHQAAGIDE